jgi:signal peptidase I
MALSDSKEMTSKESVGLTKRRSGVWEYVEAVGLAVLLALLIRTFVVQAFKIPSGSMIPTLAIGDHILVNKFIYGIQIPFTDWSFFPLREPQRYDIIVFRYPEDESKDFIKRIIGLPGDTIEVRDKVVYVNQQAIRDGFAVHQDPVTIAKEFQPRDNYGPILVPESSYFVMGDNRDHSLDSRFWGFVRQDQIRGKAFLIYWSWDGKRTWVRWDRIGKLVR